MTFDQLQQFVREDRTSNVDSLFSLHDVSERGVSVHWDEAVAIVEELCDVAIAASGDEAPVPALEDMLIGSDGRITLRRTKGDKNPSAAGRVLHTLLGNGDVPMPLRLFVTQSIVQGTHSSLRELARGLADFALVPTANHLEHRLVGKVEEAPGLSPSVGVGTAHELVADHRDVQLGHAFLRRRAVVLGASSFT